MSFSLLDLFSSIFFPPWLLSGWAEMLALTQCWSAVTVVEAGRGRSWTPRETQAWLIETGVRTRDQTLTPNSHCLHFGDLLSTSSRLLRCFIFTVVFSSFLSLYVWSDVTVQFSFQYWNVMDAVSAAGFCCFSYHTQSWGAVEQSKWSHLATSSPQLSSLAGSQQHSNHIMFVVWRRFSRSKWGQRRQSEPQLDLKLLK